MVRMWNGEDVGWCACEDGELLGMVRMWDAW